MENQGMNYEIIKDEEKLREFIQWLPELKENEKFYNCLFMRKKYCPDVPWIKSDKGQLKRFVTDKERLFDKVSQLEVKVGAYKFDGNDVPQESLACYVSVNPRDTWKATVRSIGKLATVLECNNKNANPHQEVLSEIQRTSIINRPYVIFDIDEKDDKILEYCIRQVDGYCDVIETRGGYHIYVHSDKIPDISEKLWHNNISQYADQSGDLMSPLVGTLQGMHLVSFCYRYER